MITKTQALDYFSGRWFGFEYTEVWNGVAFSMVVDNYNYQTNKWNVQMVSKHYLPGFMPEFIPERWCLLVERDNKTLEHYLLLLIITQMPQGEHNVIPSELSTF